MGLLWGLPALVFGSEMAGAYSFASSADYLAPAQQFDSWRDTLKAHAEEREQLLSCTERGAGCRGRLVSFNRVLARARGLSTEEQIDLVNLYINRTRYDDDRPKRLYDEAGNKLGIQRNRWATLHEFLTRRGDCEDYATAKYFMFRELGYDPDDMRVLITRERNVRGHHAVLAMRLPDGAVWLLDSDNRIRKGSHRSYRFIYAMNERSVWDHRDDYDPFAGGRADSN
ncbi:MAG: transglutaminase-like cysteine peptidase [Pseudomonadota bacterium]